MTAEYLLTALGQLDDDLILEAERPFLPRKRVNLSQIVNRWGTLAACCALVAALAYGVSNMGMGRNDSAASEPGASETTQDTVSPDQEHTGTAPADPQELPGFERLYLTWEGRTYTYTYYHSREDGPTVTGRLPDHSRTLGLLSAQPDPMDPYLESGRYADCRVWMEGYGGDGTVFLEVMDGEYLIFLPEEFG